MPGGSRGRRSSPRACPEMFAKVSISASRMLTFIDFLSVTRGEILAPRRRDMSVVMGGIRYIQAVTSSPGVLPRKTTAPVVNEARISHNITVREMD